MNFICQTINASEKLYVHYIFLFRGILNIYIYIGMYLQIEARNIYECMYICKLYIYPMAGTDVFNACCLTTNHKL